MLLLETDENSHMPQHQGLWFRNLKGIKKCEGNTIRVSSTIYKNQTCLQRTLPSVKMEKPQMLCLKICIFSDIWVE